MVVIRQSLVNPFTSKTLLVCATFRYNPQVLCTSASSQLHHLESGGSQGIQRNPSPTGQMGRSGKVNPVKPELKQASSGLLPSTEIQIKPQNLPLPLTTQSLTTTVYLEYTKTNLSSTRLPQSL